MGMETFRITDDLRKIEIQKNELQKEKLLKLELFLKQEENKKNINYAIENGIKLNQARNMLLDFHLKRKRQLAKMKAKLKRRKRLRALLKMRHLIDEEIIKVQNEMKHKEELEEYENLSKKLKQKENAQLLKLDIL